jgi:hypothetical protein
MGIRMAEPAQQQSWGDWARERMPGPFQSAAMGYGAATGYAMNKGAQMTGQVAPRTGAGILRTMATQGGRAALRSAPPPLKAAIGVGALTAGALSYGGKKVDESRQ